MKFDVDDKKKMSSCVCKISFKSVQVCGGCCKMFRGLTFLGHSVVDNVRLKATTTVDSEHAYIYRAVNSK